MSVKIDWNGMETKDEPYPIVWIDINELRFSREIVPYNISGLKFYNYSDNLCYRAMKVIPSMNSTKAIKTLEGTTVDQGFDNRTELDKIYARMCLVYNAIKKNMQMLNPLIVMERKGKYYMIIGWQRLCALKMLEYKGTVPCRIGSMDDYATNPATIAHPYIETPNLYIEI